MNDLPRIVIRVEQQAFDKRWPFGVNTTSIQTLAYHHIEDAGSTEAELLDIVKEYEAGRITVYLETEDDVTHTVVTFGQLQSPVGAVCCVADTVSRWAAGYLPCTMATH